MQILKRSFLGLCMLAASLAADTGQAKEPAPRLPFTKENIGPVYVIIQDLAQGGCWTNLTEAKTYAADQLGLVGIEVVDTPDKAITAMHVRVMATRNDDGYCFGAIETAIYSWVPWGSGRAYAQLLSKTVTLTDYNKVNNAVLDMVKAFATQDLAPFPDSE